MDIFVSSKKILDGFLSGANTEAEALKTLEELKGVSITIQILKETKIGESIGKIVSTKKGNEAHSVALVLQNEWKEAARKENESRKRKREEESNVLKDSTSSSVKEEPDAKRVKTEENGNGSLNESGSMNQGSSETKSEAKTEVKSESLSLSQSQTEALPFTIPTSLAPKPFVPSTGSTTRDNIQTKFFNALLVGEQFGELEPHDLAIEIENQLFELKGGANKEYTSQFRTLYSNLNDPLNTGLRHALLNGTLPASQFVRMSYEELANPKTRAERQAMEKAALEARAEDAKRKGATCTVFVCNKCKNNKTTYYQLQTRSSDEPMTTFVTCVTCGNRWKF